MDRLGGTSSRFDAHIHTHTHTLTHKWQCCCSRNGPNVRLSAGFAYTHVIVVNRLDNPECTGGATTPPEGCKLVLHNRADPQPRSCPGPLRPILADGAPASHRGLDYVKQTYNMQLRSGCPFDRRDKVWKSLEVLSVLSPVLSVVQGEKRHRPKTKTQIKQIGRSTLLPDVFPAVDRRRLLEWIEGFLALLCLMARWCVCVFSLHLWTMCTYWKSLTERDILSLRTSQLLVVVTASFDILQNTFYRVV